MANEEAKLELRFNAAKAILVHLRSKQQAEFNTRRLAAVLQCSDNVQNRDDEIQALIDEATNLIDDVTRAKIGGDMPLIEMEVHRPEETDNPNG